ncbi:MAG: hypothetical protein ABEL76_06945 [Bradymonadaceae bacterium]
MARSATDYRRTVIHSLVLCVALCSSVGCARYSLGPTAPGTAADRLSETVAVETVAVPADRGVDAGRLTRLLVRELRDRGLSRATWTRGETDGAAVRCSIAGAPPATRVRRHYVELGAHCRIVRRDGTVRTASTVGDASFAADPASGAASMRRASAASELAAADALERAAPRIVRLMATDESDADR